MHVISVHQMLDLIPYIDKEQIRNFHFWTTVCWPTYRDISSLKQANKQKYVQISTVPAVKEKTNGENQPVLQNSWVFLHLKKGICKNGQIWLDIKELVEAKKLSCFKGYSQSALYVRFRIKDVLCQIRGLHAMKCLLSETLVLNRFAQGKYFYRTI